MVRFVLLAVILRMKAELKYASITTGELSVMTTGIPGKLRSFAGSSISSMEQVQNLILFAVLTITGIHPSSSIMISSEI